MSTTLQLSDYINDYSREVFGRQDNLLTALTKDAAAAGLPSISIGPDVGRLLTILASTTCGKLAIEVGTLGGYSAIWLTRGLAPDGRLITIEPEKLHADFAESQFHKAGLSNRIELRRATALDALSKLARELGPKSVDLVFLDAIKTEYPDYWKIVRPMIAVGGLIIADNVYGSGDWFIDTVGHPSREAADKFNRVVAADPDFETVAVPIRHGVLIGRRMRA